MQGFGLMIEELDAGAVRIALRGELDLAHAYTFDEELRRVEARRPACVVLDLRELTFLDSCGLARLLAARRRARRLGPPAAARARAGGGPAPVRAVRGRRGVRDGQRRAGGSLVASARPRRPQLDLDAPASKATWPGDLRPPRQRRLVAPGGVLDPRQRPVRRLALVRARGRASRARRARRRARPAAAGRRRAAAGRSRTAASGARSARSPRRPRARSPGASSRARRRGGTGRAGARRPAPPRRTSRPSGSSRPPRSPVSHGRLGLRVLVGPDDVLVLADAPVGRVALERAVRRVVGALHPRRVEVLQRDVRHGRIRSRRAASRASCRTARRRRAWRAAAARSRRSRCGASGACVEREVELAAAASRPAGRCRSRGSWQPPVPAGVTTSSCVRRAGDCAARGTRRRARSPPGRRVSSGALPAVIAAVLGESIVASTISSATWMPCSRSSCAGRVRQRARGRRARRPQAAPGHRPPRRAAGDLDQRPPRPPHALAEEHERLLGHRARPAAEVLDRRLGERPAAERAGPRRPRRGRPR